MAGQNQLFCPESGDGSLKFLFDGRRHDPQSHPHPVIAEDMKSCELLFDLILQVLRKLVADLLRLGGHNAFAEDGQAADQADIRRDGYADDVRGGFLEPDLDLRRDIAQPSPIGAPAGPTGTSKSLPETSNPAIR